MTSRVEYAELAPRAPAAPLWARLGLAVAIAAAAWVAWMPTLRAIFSAPGDPVRHVVETFDRGVAVHPSLVTVTGFEGCPGGFCLPPDTSGTLTYRLDATPGYPVELRLWHRLPPGGTLRLYLSTDGGARYQLLSENSTYDDWRGQIPSGAKGKTLLHYEVQNPSASTQLVIDQMVLAYHTAPVPRFPTRWTVFLIVLSMGLAFVVLSKKHALALSTVLIVALAASLRYDAAVQLYFTPLDPDVEMYRYHASVMRLFSETGFFSARFSEREPGYIFFMKVYGALFGDSAFSFRLMGLLMSTLAVWAVLRTTRALFGDIAGQCAGLAMALNVPLMAEATRALRLELEIVLCMVFLGLAFARKWRAPWPLETLAMAIAGAATVVTRSTYVPIVLALGTYAVYRRLGFKAAIGGALIVTTVVAAGVVPHRYNMYKLRGNAYWDTMQYARWNANQEFAGRPGFPTPEELQTDSYIGPPISYAEYMLGMHTTMELIVGTARGYAKLYRNMDVAPYGIEAIEIRRAINFVFLGFGLAGFAIALVKREYLWIPFAFLLFEFPVSFLYDRMLVEPYRHSYSAFPLVLFAVVVAVRQLVHAFTPAPSDHSIIPGPARQRYMRAREAHWDDVARESDRTRGWGAYYHARLAEVYSTLVAPGQRVLELGCSRGDLLAAVRPAYGLGIDLSREMVTRAARDHTGLEFRQGDVHDLSDLREPFDVIILSDLVNDLWDVQTVFQEVRRLSHPRTRIVLNLYSRLWEVPLGAASSMKLARPTLHQNWLTVEDTANLLFLSDLEIVRRWEEVLWPVGTPLVAGLMNRYVAKLWPFKHLALSNFVIARPQPERRSAPGAAPGALPTVTVVVPARNEAGNIANAFARTPVMGGGTELIFVEGNSKDDTYDTIVREIAAHPEWDSRVFKQTGKGKGDAVRLGYAHAKGDILMILDADLTMPPEDLPRFYEALASGKAEFANGVRLVYPQEKEAMRFFNLIGNKFFSLAFSWLLGQPIKDTLCGTKVMWREDYERVAANRAYFGDFDPFGDFDLLFGAAKLGLKIVDVPIRYRERTYGETNINRWSHGLLLLRMVVFAARRIKFI